MRTTSINHNLTFLVTVSTFAVLSIIVMFLNFQPVYSENPELSYLDVNDTSSVSKFTVAAWFKTSNNFKSDAFIVNKAGDGGNMNYGIWMTNAEKIEGGFENSQGNRMDATSPLSYNDGNWHYAMVTFDGSIINLYVDGVMVATESTSGSPDNGGNEPVRVGANSEKPTDYFVGDVDEVRVWKRALTSLEAADAYNSKFDTDGQILYLDFSEPIVPVNNTAINATSINGTSINGTSINGTSINGTTINGTSINGTTINGPQLIQLTVYSINGTSIISASINGTSINATEIKEFNPSSTFINESDIQGNATTGNETGFEEVNETSAIENATDQSDIQGNATATNETGFEVR